MTAMDDVRERIESMALSGMCCSAILVALALDHAGKEDPEMVRHATSLCRGLHSGMTCGALTGGILALSILHGREPLDPADVQEYVAWFEGQFGAVDCRDLLEDDPLASLIRCRQITREAFVHALDCSQSG
jgi:hypothetical protein